MNYNSAEVSKINKAKWQYSELYMIRLIIIKGQLTCYMLTDMVNNNKGSVNMLHVTL